jgi:hypothetical protein
MARPPLLPDRSTRPPTRWGNSRLVRRWVAVHRRSISAALAFAAVLFGLAALTPAAPASSPVATDAPLADDERAVPLRIDDAGIASLLEPGDIIDVVGTDPRGSTSLIAGGVRVTSVPTPGSSWSGDDGGLVVVAAEPTTALAIAGASTRGSVTVTIHP